MEFHFRYSMMNYSLMETGSKTLDMDTFGCLLFREIFILTEPTAIG
jgi:hypothetical protein